MRSSRWATFASVVCVMMLNLAGCTAEDRPAPADGWRLESVPAGFTISAMAVNDHGLLIGGATGSGAKRQPGLRMLRDGKWRAVTMAAATEYGAQATINRLALTGDDRIIAIGTATGGAHLNPRWTAWMGTLTVVAEEPQGSETFGGPHAGGITSVVAGADPVVVGSWSISDGAIGIATWRHAGRAWTRQPATSVLAGGDQDGQTTAVAAVAAGGRVVIAGLVTSFRQGQVHQQAAVWIGSGPTGWSRIPLDSSAADSAATDLACTGDSCLVVGRLDGRLAAWRLTGSKAAPVGGLPELAVDRYLSRPRVAAAAPKIVIATGAGGGLLSSSAGASGPWTSPAAPAGARHRIAICAGRLYLLTTPAHDEDAPAVLYSRSL